MMTYGDRLKRWVVVLLLPKMQRIDVASLERKMSLQEQFSIRSIAYFPIQCSR